MLRAERKLLTSIRELLATKVNGVGFSPNNEVGSGRRTMLTQILGICARPDRKRVNGDLLLAASFLHSYNDEVASALLAKIDGDYKEAIVKLKKEV